MALQNYEEIFIARRFSANQSLLKTDLLIYVILVMVKYYYLIITKNHAPDK